MLHAPTLLLLAVQTLGAPAETAAPDLSRYADDVQRILREAVARGRAYDSLAELVQVAPHRLSGSPGAAAAVEWSREAMQRAGLQNVRLEPCTVTHWVRGEVARLEVAHPPAGWSTSLPILALGNSVATPAGGLTAELVRVTSFEELEELGAAGLVKGKIVFYDTPFPHELYSPFEAYGKTVKYRTQGAWRAAQQGAVATVVRSMSSRLDDTPHTGNQGYREGVPQIPTCAVSTLGADRLAALLARSTAGRPGEWGVSLTLELDCETRPPAPSFNVVGELVGREQPDEVLVVGGHLDAWDVGQGAHDDGGGCCQALEAARLLLALDLVPRRTIRVVHFMNEENGLGGGRAFYEQHAGELERVVMALESDSGSFAPRSFTTDANPDAFAILQAATRLMGEWGIAPAQPGGGGADIGPMKAAGVVLVGLRPDPQRYFGLHHSERDTLEQVEPREINLGAGVMAALLYTIADMEAPLPRNTPPAK